MLEALEPVATSAGAYAFVVVLGLLWGSFANVCIYRWPPTDAHPRGRSVVAPGSHCFACQAPVAWYDNVPLLSWLWLRGRCRRCGTGFSARYLIVEALTGALFGVAWWATVHMGALWDPFDVRLIRFAIYAAFCFVMVVVTFIDLDHQLILDKVTLPSIAVFYAAGLLLPERRWFDGALGAAVGYGVPWLIGEIYYRVRGREGMGLGDSKLLAVVGALLGWQGVVVSLFGGATVGAVIGVAMLWGGRRAATTPPPTDDAEPADDDPEADSILRTELPFGPFLALAAVFWLFAEPWIQLHFRWGGG